MSTSSFKRHTLNTALMSLIIATLPSLVGCGDDIDALIIPPVTEEPLTPNLPPVVEPRPSISDAQLLSDPAIIKTFSATELKQAMNDAGFAEALDADPVCGVMVYHVDHTTTGLRGEATNATEAVFRPMGEADECQGRRPVTLYAHGTTPFQNYNLAALDDSSNPAYSAALLLAANFAGQGDIVVAPNYPGYDESDLPYAPYVTQKQGAQMVDALQAGYLTFDWIHGLYQVPQPNDDNTLPNLGNDVISSLPYLIEASDQVFITGYSQGGYVALAAAEALDKLGVPATAVSPASGPYALTAFADSIMSGNVIYGGSLFLPMLTNSYAQEYSMRYPNITDGVFNERYSDAASIFPTNENIRRIFISRLPTTQLFESAPTGYPQLEGMSPPSPYYQFGFDDTRYLFNTEFRANYVQDMLANPDTIYPTFMPQNASTPPNSAFNIRQAFIDNDLRAYNPSSPTLLCGGHQDPTVTFSVNTAAQSRIWQDNSAVSFAMLDIDTSVQGASNTTSQSTNEQTVYFSTLDAAVSAPVQQAGSQLQQQFSDALDMMLTNSYQTAYSRVLSLGLTEAEAQSAGDKARADALLSGYHSMLAPYCLSAANVFFEQYR